MNECIKCRSYRMCGGEKRINCNFADDVLPRLMSWRLSLRIKHSSTTTKNSRHLKVSWSPLQLGKSKALLEVSLSCCNFGSTILAATLLFGSNTDKIYFLQILCKHCEIFDSKESHCHDCSSYLGDDPALMTKGALAPSSRKPQGHP